MCGLYHPAHSLLIKSTKYLVVPSTDIRYKRLFEKQKYREGNVRDISSKTRPATCLWSLLLIYLRLFIVVPVLTKSLFEKQKYLTNYYGNFLALISGVFSDLRSPEIRTIYYGTENHPYFCSQFLEGAKISKSSQNWRQF